MKEDVLSILIESEKEYEITVKNAVNEAEEYVDDRRREQAAHIEDMKQGFFFYEKTESDKVEKALVSESEKLETEAARLKKQMKIRRDEKADRISELLKEEVLSLLWR